MAFPPVCHLGALAAALVMVVYFLRISISFLISTHLKGSANFTIDIFDVISNNEKLNFHDLDKCPAQECVKFSFIY